MVQLKFPRKLRLLTSSHYSFVFQKPQKIEVGIIIIFNRLNTLEHPRLGLSVSKKVVNHANERNRIKRLIRESFRLYQHDLPNMDFVVMVRNKAAELNNHFFLKKMKELWLRYSRI